MQGGGEVEREDKTLHSTRHSLCLHSAFGFLKCCLGIVREPQTRTMKWHKKTVKKRSRRVKRTVAAAEDEEELGNNNIK